MALNGLLLQMCLDLVSQIQDICRPDLIGDGDDQDFTSSVSLPFDAIWCHLMPFNAILYHFMHFHAIMSFDASLIAK